jgi:thiol-disulfide isomerase/thioredoxin
MPGLGKARLSVAVAALWVCSSAAALSPGDVPPPIDTVDEEGREVDLEELRGQVVLVDFWASWCGPCREELPVLEKLHRELASQGLVIVGINIDRTKKKMTRFLETRPLTFRIVHDPKLVVASRYEPPTMPSSYLIARDGRLRHVHEGFRKSDGATIESRIRALLAEEPPSDGSP